EVPTAYARSKAEADAALERIDADWLIVKPSLVIGRGAFGGTALMRGLAGLAAQHEPARRTLDAAGPETVSLREILVAYRNWLGFGRAHEIALPLPFLRLLLRVGDVAGYVGYVTSARTTSLEQLRYDTLVDGAEFAAAAGGDVKGFSATLAAWPATLQDRL